MINNDFICTVLIISYNQGKTIRRAIDSVIEQESKYPFRIDIFDDGSTDGTEGIISEYCSKYPEFIFSHRTKENRGPQNNYWRAFSSVKTAYCVLLEADDYYCHKKKIEMQIDALEKHPQCSFCGHDTLLYSNEEKYREYEQGSKAMTEGFLKEKQIFNYKDFLPHKKGGYICYGSARMIRTSCMQLDEITYKEAFLFDHTQFYYLLLKGDYYYIDIPMSAYVRIGGGLCSGKSPVVFLNDFVQAVIDFNRETNNIIADKMWEDVMLQTGFRLQLFHKNNYGISASALFNKRVKRMENAPFETLSPVELSLPLEGDKYYILCTKVDYAVFVVNFIDELQKRLDGEIVLLLNQENSFVADAYGVSNYVLVDDYYIDEELIAKNNKGMAKGEIFAIDPFLYKYNEVECNKLVDLLTTQRYNQWLCDIYNLPEKKYYVTDKEIYADKIIPGVNVPSNVAILMPESDIISPMSRKKWETISARLNKEGIDVVSYVENEKNKIKYSRYIELSKEQWYYLSMQCHSVYTMRNSFTDILSSKGEDLHVYYSSHASWYVYSINKNYSNAYVDENICLDVDRSIECKFRHERKVMQNLKPKLFGIIPLPLFVVRYYYKNYERLSKFKKLGSWS